MDTKARRSGNSQCRFDSGRPSFMPTENSESSTATSATRSSRTVWINGSGVRIAHPAGPRAKPAAR